MLSRPQKIFFSGIGGSGVSAVACFLKDKGHKVTGSDRAFDTEPGHPLKKTLISKGIHVVPQDGAGLDRTFDQAVFSTAVERDMPELVRAKELGIRVRSRPEYLVEIASAYRTVAVSGTSGKSTVSGMIAFLMNRLGLHPNFIGGGRVKQFRTGSNPGNAVTGASDMLIMEACESDGSIVNYHPAYSIILNLSLDHHPVEETSRMFRTLAAQTSEQVIMNADDKNLMSIAQDSETTFSIDSASAFRAEGISYGPLGSEFFVGSTRFRLSVPGRFSVYNALACLALLSLVGIPAGSVADAMHEFTGIERRFDVVYNDGRRIVIDDYAHNPHKISFLMETAQNLASQTCYIFQPHGYSPTKLMFEKYIEVFVENLRDHDRLLLLPIYYAGGTVSRDISSNDLADAIGQRGKNAEAIASRGEVCSRLHGYECCIVFGARDDTLSELAREIAATLKG